ncbi:universal stress protein [Desulfovibrio inopinatus]|uniref:universal stress protein n=1 Tax=Desulfovibrio inopinatus TaxID=102109 RepID=UPI00040FB8C6|nr:universal stress protein [Desulfovibrio inopinatus]
MDVKTILWPTDLSSVSLQAAPHVLSLSQKYGANVVVLYVAIDLCNYFPAYGNYPSRNIVQEFQSWEVEQAKTKLEGLCERELKACPNVRIRLLQGDPVEEILASVKKENAQMIVLTTRGHGQDKKGMTKELGSTAEMIVKNAFVPVVTVSPEA